MIAYIYRHISQSKPPLNRPTADCTPTMAASKRRTLREDFANIFLFYYNFFNPTEY